MAFDYAQPMNHWHDQYFKKNGSLASAITSDALCCGETQGSLVVVVEAAAAVSVGNGNSLTVTFTHCDTADGEYAALAPAVSTVLTATASTSYAAGDVIMKALIPMECKDFVKVVLTPTTANSGTASTGSVNISLNYVAR